MKYLAPEYVYCEAGLQTHKLLAIDDEGRIAALVEYGERPEGEVIEMPGLALLPGFVNVHSHIFQRGLRGHTHRSLARHDSFWSWRSAMYQAAAQLTPESLYEQAVKAYREMLAAGYCSVGEFHYVHHRPGGEPYERANAMSEAILRAGQDAGIRVVLLMTAYARGGFNQPPDEEQLRFCDRTVEDYLLRVEALRQAGFSVGVAPHSVRAVPEDWLRAIASYSREKGVPLHIHADEQVGEIEQCRAVHHCTPIELLERCGVLGPSTTIVHATHADEDELQLLAKYGCSVCVCPTTEGDLGDGIAPYEKLRAFDIPLCIGSDSNTRLDPFEELRWAEYSARMRYQRRRVLVADDAASPGPLLLDYGTRRGAMALGVMSGRIAPDLNADFVAIDLAHPSLHSWNEQDLLDVLFFGASASVIKQVWVQGELKFYV